MQRIGHQHRHWFIFKQMPGCSTNQWITLMHGHSGS